MSLSSGPEIGSDTERRFSPIHMFLRCYKLREIERRGLHPAERGESAHRSRAAGPPRQSHHEPSYGHCLQGVVNVPHPPADYPGLREPTSRFTRVQDASLVAAENIARPFLTKSSEVHIRLPN